MVTDIILMLMSLIGTSIAVIDPQVYVTDQCVGSIGTQKLDCFLNKTNCVDLKKWRNCQDDCGNNIDEQCFIGTWQCDGCACVKNDKLLDGNDDCVDQTDEDRTKIDECAINKGPNCPAFSTCYDATDLIATCKCDWGYIDDGNGNCVVDYSVRTGMCNGEFSFTCNDQTCIPYAEVRDCISQCSSGEDESCPGGTYQCDRCKCVDPSQIMTQCSENLSTKICEMTTLNITVMSCDIPTSPSTSCVLKEWVLDGENDCANWADEDECTINVGTISCTEGKVPNAHCEDNNKTSPISFKCVCDTGFVAGDPYDSSVGCALPTTTSTTTTSTTTTSTTTTTPTTTTSTTPTTTTTTTPTTTTSTTTTPTTTTTTTPTTTTSTTTPTTTTSTTTPTTTTSTTSTTTTPTTTTTTTPTTTTSTTTTTTPTTTTSTTTTTTPTTTTTTTTPMQFQPLTNPISLVFVVEDNTKMAIAKAVLLTAMTKFSNELSVIPSTLIPKYLLVVYGNGGATTAYNGALPSAFVNALSSSWTLTGSDPPCGQNVLGGLTEAVTSAAFRSIIYVHAASDANDLNLLVSLMEQIIDKQLQVNFIISGNCGNTSSDGYKVFETIASATSGCVYEVTNPAVGSEYAVFVDQLLTYGWTSEPRFTIEMDKQPATSSPVYLNIPVDASITNVMLFVVGEGCLPSEILVRNAKGIWLTPTTDAAGPVVLIGNMKYASFLTILTPEPAMWLLKVTTTCTVKVRAVGAGDVDYRYKFSVQQPTVQLLTIPTYGIGSWIRTEASDLNSTHNDFDLTIVELVEVQESINCVAASRFDAGQTMTSKTLQPTSNNFFIKLLGQDKNGKLMQRYSYTTFKAVETDVITLMFYSKCIDPQKSFWCGPNAGNASQCISTNGFRNCTTDCITGVDEACMYGYRKCGCLCLNENNYGKSCIDPVFFSLCDLTPDPINPLYTCKNGACIPQKWVMDGSDDCEDHSDEMSNLIDECELGKDQCDANAVCNNIVNGKYYCTCNAGFTGDGFICIQDTTTVATTTVPVVTTTAKPWNSIDGLNTDACPGEYDCGDGTCILLAKYRDCVQDCNNGADEICPSSMVQCDTCTCVANDQAIIDQVCMNKRIDDICSSPFLSQTTFKCKATLGCIILQFAMDGVADCADGSDEVPLYFDECYLGRNSCNSTMSTCLDSVSDFSSPYRVDGRHQCDCKAGFSPINDGLGCKMA